MADDNQDQSFAPIAAKWLGSGTDDGNIQRTARALRVAIDIPGTVPHPNIAYWCETLTGHQEKMATTMHQRCHSTKTKNLKWDDEKPQENPRSMFSSNF